MGLAKLTGVSIEDHIGKTVREVIPSVYDQAAATFQSVMHTSRPVDHLTLSATLATAGALHYWKESWYPVREDSGQVIGVAVIVEDVTELIKAARGNDPRLAASREFGPRMSPRSTV